MIVEQVLLKTTLVDLTNWRSFAYKSQLFWQCKSGSVALK